jgi:hypothetical protein
LGLLVSPSLWALAHGLSRSKPSHYFCLQQIQKKKKPAAGGHPNRSKFAMSDDDTYWNNQLRLFYFR